MLKCFDYLDNTSESGCGFEMSNVRLHRSNVQRRLIFRRLPEWAENVPESSCFCQVANLCSRSVGFNVGCF